MSDTEDPKGQGRVRARVPEVLGDVESGWALPCAPFAGPNLGFFAVPPVGSLVWVEFEAGDVSRPIWAGCFWGEEQRPQDASGERAAPSLRILRSERGLLVGLDDERRTVTISDESGGNAITIEVDSGTVTVKGSSKVIVDAPAIEVVGGASQSAVLGDRLLQYLNQVVSTFAAHTHPGATAGPYPVSPMVPTPSLPSPSAMLLSTRVKVG